MKIHFRDVQTGMVEARAVIEIDSGVFLNEVTLLNIEGQLVVEFPRKNFIGKNDRTHHLDIITFENEDKRILWELQVKQAYREWRKDNRKVLVYEDKPQDISDDTISRRPFKERSIPDKRPRRDSDRSSRGERPYSSNRTFDDKPRRDGPRGEKTFTEKRSYRDRSGTDNPRGQRSYSEKRSFSDRPRNESSYSDKRSFSDRPRGEKSFNEKRSYRDRSGTDNPRSQSSYSDKRYSREKPRSDRPVKRYQKKS